MPPTDMQDAFRRAGMNPRPDSGSGQPTDRERGRRRGQDRGGGRGGPPRRGLPDGYLEDGYFDSSGKLKPELLTELAEDVALRIGQASPRQSPRVKYHQLRNFFHPLRRIERRYLRYRNFEELREEIWDLVPKVRYARGRKDAKVTDEFVQFIECNVARVQDVKSFRRGFLKHFEAVLCNYVYFYGER